MNNPIDSVVIPKFCATCEDEGTVYFSGQGDTPEEAFNEFMTNGQFEDQCAEWIAAPGDPIEVLIYSVVDIKDSAWPEEEIESGWAWCLDEKIENRIVEAV